MKKVNFLIFLFSLLSINAYCCGNEYESPTITYTKADGGWRSVDRYKTKYYLFDQNFDLDMLKQKKAAFIRSKRGIKNYKEYSDYGLVLLKLGEYQKSLKIFQELIKVHPQEYTINANLGTAYELNDQPDSALKYIQRAISINPQSHNGSEWIHVKILEYKLKFNNVKQDSAVNILDLQFDFKSSYDGEKLVQLNKIRSELQWQLEERIKFVKPQDAVVSKLLINFADLVAVTEYYETAMPIYSLALDYDSKNYEIINSRKEELKKMIQRSKMIRYSLYGFLVVVGILLVIYGIVKWRRRTKRKAKEIVSAIPVFDSIHLNNIQ